MPARRIVNTLWEVSGEVVIAVTRLSNTVLASDDDVAAERITSTEGSIGLVYRTGECACCWIICDLRTGNRGRGSEDEGSVHHFDNVLMGYPKSSVFTVLIVDVRVCLLVVMYCVLL